MVSKMIKVAVAALMLVAVFASPASATAGAADCPGPGTGARFCMYTSPDYLGSRWQIGLVAVGTCTNIAAPYDNNFDSFANKTVGTFYIYEGYNCLSGDLLTAAFPYGSPGQTYFDPNMSPSNNETSSVKRVS